MVGSPEHYDLIVVGGGPGGCAVAARVADARPSWRIALVETGPARGNALISAPTGIIATLPKAGPYNYAYETVPQPGLNGRRGYQPRGRGVGGSSLINAMVYIRGQRADYDAWAAAGCTGWGWDDLLPLFRRSEDNVRGSDVLHGSGGPLHIDDSWSDAPVTDAFLQAAQEAGYPLNPDFNGPTQEGVGRYQVFQKKGRRFDAGSAYIHSRPHPNLTVMAKTQALRLTFEGRRATGVLVRGPAGEQVLKTSREIVIAGGAFGTPQLLMLSGVGPAAQLRAQGIAVIADRAEVGENLQDHLDYLATRPLRGAGALGLTVAGAAPVLKGFVSYLQGRRSVLSSNLSEAGGFIRATATAERPDVQLHFTVAMAEDHARTLVLKTGVSLHVCQLRPHSRGNVRLANADARSSLLIDPKYLSDPRDLEVMIAGVRVAETILSQPAIARFEVKATPTLDITDESAVIGAIRRRADTVYHPVGTCRMGSDAAAVVDPELRVRGVSGLRIADASIMPALISGNTQAATAVIGERAADLILRDSND